jgi:hypothetical protein
MVRWVGGLLYMHKGYVLNLIYLLATKVQKCLENLLFLDTLILAKLSGSRMNKGKTWKSLGKKETFLAFSDVCYLEKTSNLMQFLYACKIPSPTDKRNTNNSITDFFKAQV